MQRRQGIKNKKKNWNSRIVLSKWSRMTKLTKRISNKVGVILFFFFICYIHVPKQTAFSTKSIPTSAGTSSWRNVFTRELVCYILQQFYYRYSTSQEIKDTFRECSPDGVALTFMVRSYFAQPRVVES